MKKLGAIFLFIIYTSTALGASINFHYCKGHLEHVSVLNFGGKTGCSCNNDAMPKGCCKDELLYKKADNHKTAQESYTINTALFTPDLPPVSDRHNRIQQGNEYDSGNFYTGARRSRLQPIYLLIRVFRI